MQHGPPWPGSEVRGYGQVVAGRIDVAEIVDRQGCFMGDHGPIATPQAPAHQFFVFAVGPLGKSVKTSVDAGPVPPIRVVPLGLMGIACRPGLSRCELTGLEGGQTDQPTTKILAIRGHEAGVA